MECCRLAETARGNEKNISEVHLVGRIPLLLVIKLCCPTSAVTMQLEKRSAPHPSPLPGEREDHLAAPWSATVR